ncbi:MAG: HPF/RaiA family ribosome-associated protein [Phycisphaerae bacterium]
MEIQITTHKITAHRALRSFIIDALAAALERFVALIAVAHVEISDRNGRRGGGDKRCRIRLELKAGQPVLVEDVAANPRRAIVHAASRAQAAVRNQLRTS